MWDELGPSTTMQLSFTELHVANVRCASPFQPLSPFWLADRHMWDTNACAFWLDH